MQHPIFKLIYSFLMTMVFSTIISVPSAVYFDSQGGWFGNWVQAYAHALYFSHISGLELIYPPRPPYSDALMLSNYHKQYNCANNCFPYKKTVYVTEELTNLTKLEREDVLYNVRWFAPFACEGEWAKGPFEVQWDEPAFLSLLRRDIAPRQTALLDEVPLAKNKINVAIHVRCGKDVLCSNLDDLGWLRKSMLILRLTPDNLWPQKFPPIDYYVEQLRLISTRLQHRPIYAHIFTDHERPNFVAQKIQQLIGLSNIELGYRKTGNAWDQNILADFFAISRFDAVIIPASCFSYLPSKIGYARFVVMPDGHKHQNGKLVINRVKIIERYGGLQSLVGN